MAIMAQEKPVKCIVLDAGPLILNDPSISSLLAKSEELYTTSAVISEIRDPTARARLETTVRPFLKIRNPTPASIKVVSDFARRTGDLSVVSSTDLQILALAYELECDKNGGDWRLRRVPGQKALNGPAPTKASSDHKSETENVGAVEAVDVGSGLEQPVQESAEEKERAQVESENVGVEQITQEAQSISLSDTANAANDRGVPTIESSIQEDGEGDDDDDDDDDDGDWITAGNLASKKAKDEAVADDIEDTASDQAVMEVATITTDYAMQNVLLQMNLNLLSTALRRIKNIKSHILRCHGCFATTKEMDRQFCARCGKPTLTRVACSTKSNGTFVLHLKKNFQYNKRGDRYSVPKPTHGSSNGRVQGGGKGGWGAGLILTEDQKEYQRAMTGHNKTKKRNPMDEDYLPGILTGERGGTGNSRPKVGAGRNINSRKR